MTSRYAARHIRHPTRKPSRYVTPVTHGGKDTIDHSPGAHDDIANVVAGVANVRVNRHTVIVEPLVI